MKNNLDNLKTAFEQKKNLEFLFFWGHQIPSDGSITKSCFSQWYPATFIENDIQFANTEQYMMAKKAELFGDLETQKRILAAHSPKEMKALGRLVKNFDADLWNNHKYDIVKQGNFLIFSQNKEMGDFLLNTNQKVIVEASPYDRIWGIGMLESHPHSKNPTLWNGENLLGFALMEVRALLKM
ncbi:NADAR family protein [Rhizosphaericola mali]|uniref:NADAR family protein n=1 Tax=Rhizosphaericola mali TaxID=2545455 RepID=A0A5P2GAH2_9BACT|nr:NADAR family protein [Rhizosphaericola mali]QES90700.1 NADAR family protein [Rhizosphaericola mali]